MPKTNVEIVSNIVRNINNDYYSIGDWFEIDDTDSVEYAVLVAVNFDKGGAKVGLVYPATGLRYTDPIPVDNFYKIPHDVLFPEDGITITKVNSVSITVHA